jgi:hypothetical protein
MKSSNSRSRMGPLTVTRHYAPDHARQVQALLHLLNVENIGEPVQSRPSRTQASKSLRKNLGENYYREGGGMNVFLHARMAITLRWPCEVLKAPTQAL